MKLKISFPGNPLPFGKEKFIVNDNQLEPVSSENIEPNHSNPGLHIVGSIIVVVVLTLLFWPSISWAQDKLINGLKIGDRLPDITINNILNFKGPDGKPATPIKISDFKGKLLILDFWATWCGSCINHFQDVSKIQDTYKNDLMVLLVNSTRDRDTKEKILALFERKGHDYKSGFPFPTLFDDTVLTGLFPHYSIPHYVWIGKDGIVKAITAAEELTEHNINLLLKNNALTSYSKEDVPANQPLYTVNNLPVENLLHFSILFKGKLDGLGGGARVRKIGGSSRGMVYNNRSIFNLYQMAASHIIKDFNPKQTLLTVSDSSFLLPPLNDLNNRSWQRKNLYSFELIVPADQFGNFYRLMLEDLNRYSGYRATILSKELNCWILSRIPNHDVIATKGGHYKNSLAESDHQELQNANIRDLCDWLCSMTGPNEPVINETGYSHIDIYFEQGSLQLSKVNNQLSKFGLKLSKTLRILDVLEITNK